MSRTRYIDGADRIRRNVVIDENGCWIWQRKINRQTGYGSLSIPGPKRQEYSHRYSYETFVGPIPAGLNIDHLCRVRACCNPEHLEPVTQQVNVHRSPVAVAALNAAKTHCKRGHEFTPENTNQTARGWRSCRTCQREHQRRYLTHRAFRAAGMAVTP